MADRTPETIGPVYLVGAGPGDPGLITVKGLHLLESADIVVYDRLVDRRLLDRAPVGAELMDAGKTPGGPRVSQTEIESLLVDRARAGKRVVRLKGGDPFVFGRGGEEAAALADAGIPFEVVPGVTSAIAAPAYAGIPLTHREVASSFAVVTGSETPDKGNRAVDWDALSQAADTIVVLMGWDNLDSITSSLIDAGRSPDTPVALVRWGTEPHQTTVVGTLADIKAKATEAGMAAPIVAVVGNVVRLRDRLGWFDNRPLFGKRVLVTRTRTQASGLSHLLEGEGAIPIEVPTIETRPLDSYDELDEALRQLDSYDWVVFASVNAVASVFDRLAAIGLDARAFGTAKAAAIGTATAAGLTERGIQADFVPSEQVSDAAVDGLQAVVREGDTVLLPRANIGRQVIARGLESVGARVHEVIAYETVAPKRIGQRVEEVLKVGVDAATFASSSAVRNLVAHLDGQLHRLEGATIACIGPTTAEAAADAGLDVDVVAGEHTVRGLVEALKGHFASEASIP